MTVHRVTFPHRPILLPENRRPAWEFTRSGLSPQRYRAWPRERARPLHSRSLALSPGFCEESVERKIHNSSERKVGQIRPDQILCNKCNFRWLSSLWFPLVGNRALRSLGGTSVFSSEQQPPSSIRHIKRNRQLFGCQIHIHMTKFIIIFISLRQHSLNHSRLTASKNITNYNR